ncbi:hypothetical protein ACVMB0_006188 [Bradyrhizobium sp. USDA 4451]
MRPASRAADCQSAEIDRRPRQPRQLAGEYGSSESAEVCFDAGATSGTRFFDAAADAVRCCKSPDDPVNADRPAVDVAFKPKCLGIESSIQLLVAHAVRRPQVQSEHVVAIQSKRFA